MWKVKCRKFGECSEEEKRGGRAAETKGKKNAKKGDKMKVKDKV